MTCPRCSATLEGGARFCGVCGHRLESQAMPAPAPPAPAPPTPAAPSPRAASEAGKTRSPTSREKPRARTTGKKVSQIAVAAMVPTTDPYIGTTLNGRFTVEKKLGEGGFGAVYNGVQLLTGRRVAIKLLHPEMTRDQNVVARFRREGQVLCSLRDAHTITTYDFDQTANGTLFIAMELLEGRSLHDVFHDEAPIAWQRMLKIMSEMCSSLEEAHTLGIVHRDLKPENVYLEPRPGNPEFVKILDFGIAKVMRGDGSSGIAGDMSPQLTATGQTLGTLEYMSPEQLMGKPLDGRSDIYGLGVLAFELMTGQLPFPDAVGPAALISAQLKKVPPSASQIYAKGGIPVVVDQLIIKMLAKDKNQRFRDVNELRREIDGILSTGGVSLPSRPSSSAPAQPPPPASSPSPARTPVPSPSAPSPEPRPARSSSAAPVRPAPGRPAQVVPALGGAPDGAVGYVGPSASAAPDAITARAGAGWPPPAPRGPGFGSPGQPDPPWAGGGPAGSAINPGTGRPLRGASAGAGGEAELPLPRSRAPASARPASSPWMWIAVAAILLLAVIIGGVLATR